jgi:hypothetical protein
MNEEPEKTTNPPSNSTRARKLTAARNHSVGAIAALNRYNEPHFDLALLPRTDWPDEIWDARMAKLMRAIGAALKGEETTPFVESESPEIQVDGLDAWQQKHSEYYQWSEFEKRQLLEYLEQHPGHVLTPKFAHSCEMRAPDGRVFHYHRSGRLE